MHSDRSALELRTLLSSVEIVDETDNSERRDARAQAELGAAPDTEVGADGEDLHEDSDHDGGDADQA